MNRRHVGAVLLLLIGLGVLRAGSNTNAAEKHDTGGTESPWVDVKDVKVEHFGTGRRLTITLTRTPEVFRT